MSRQSSSILFPILLAAAAGACSEGGSSPVTDMLREILVEGDTVAIEGPAAAWVDTPVSLDYHTHACDVPHPLWSVTPSDGATVSESGVFAATKPGDYVVDVMVCGLSADHAIRVTPRDATASPTAASPGPAGPASPVPPAGGVAGTYVAHWETESGGTAWVMDLRLTVDASGRVAGTLEADGALTMSTEIGGKKRTAESPLHQVFALAGSVDEGGRVEAANTSIVWTDPTSGTTETTPGSEAFALRGTIADGVLSGDVAGQAVLARRE